MFVPGISTLAMGEHAIPADAGADSMIVTVNGTHDVGETASRVRSFPGVESVISR